MHRDQFVIVDGMSAVLHRVPVVTEDVDIVHDRAEDNVERLVLALEELDAVYREIRGASRPDPTHLSRPGHRDAEIGRVHFDVLGTIDDGLVYSGSPSPFGRDGEVAGVSSARAVPREAHRDQAKARSTEGQVHVASHRGNAGRARAEKTDGALTEP